MVWQYKENANVVSNGKSHQECFFPVESCHLDVTCDVVWEHTDDHVTHVQLFSKACYVANVVATRAHHPRLDALGSWQRQHNLLRELLIELLLQLELTCCLHVVQGFYLILNCHSDHVVLLLKHVLKSSLQLLLAARWQ